MPSISEFVVSTFFSYWIYNIILVLQSSFVKAGLFFMSSHVSIMHVDDAGYLLGADFVLFFLLFSFNSTAIYEALHCWVMRCPVVWFLLKIEILSTQTTFHMNRNISSCIRLMAIHGTLVDCGSIFVFSY